MACYHQMGNNSTNLLFEAELKSYAGAVLSPVNEDQSSVATLLAKARSKRPDIEMIFDPQLYFPTSDRGELKTWAHFPKDVDSADLSSATWWTKTNQLLVGVVNTLRPDAVCSPAVVPRVFQNGYYDQMVNVGDELKRLLPDLPVLQTVIVGFDDITAANRAEEIASIVSRSKCERIFLVVVTDVDPRLELSDIESLKGVMRLIRLLERNKQRVLVGFSSTDVVLWKMAGASDCATGKFFNLRRFTKSRFAPPAGGGGQIAYFCEEALLALLRASDVVRVQAQGAFSAATQRNPFTQTILGHIQKGTPWVKFGWRHYLWWFADFEQRSAAQGLIGGVIKSADDKWKEFDKKSLYMEERTNDGSWVRQWLRIDTEFKAWLATLP